MHEPMNASSIRSPATSRQQLDVVRIVGTGQDGLSDLGQVDLEHGRVFGVLIAFEKDRAWPAIFRRPRSVFSRVSAS